MHQSLRTLLSGLIDYAGLFPPAKLSMDDAVSEFARRRMGDEAYALGSFICPVSRLEEFSSIARIQMPGTYATSGYREMAGSDMADPWAVSVVIDRPLGEALDEIDRFNEHHAVEDHGLAKVGQIETRVAKPGEIDEALDEIPTDLMPFFEFPYKVVAEGDPRGFIAALSGNDGAAAKIRCGGVKAEMIPPVEAVAGFIEGCAIAGVAFKATAGLHHPVRSEQPLTYEDTPPRAVMHGFLNVFCASALARAKKIDRAGIEAVLSITDPAAFSFAEGEIRAGDHVLTAVEMAACRERFAVGYGSCSFGEPMDDLRAMGAFG